MNLKGNKRKWLSFCAVMLCCILVLPGIRVQAEEAQNVERTITFTPLSYDITNETIEMQISTNALDCYLAYYVYNPYEENLSYEEQFVRAVKTTETSAVVTTEDETRISVWYVDAEGNRISTNTDIDAKQDDNRSALLLGKNPDIEYVNGTVLDFDPQFKIQNGNLYWNSLPECEKGYGHMLDTSRSYKIYSYNGQGYSKLFGSDVPESGSYEFYFWLKGDGVMTRPTLVTYNYVRPEQKLGTVENLEWDKARPGVITFSTIDGAVDYYEVLLYKVRADGALLLQVGRGVREGVCDLSSYMNEEGAKYCAGVRALSTDIETVLSGDEVFSDIYDPSNSSDNVDNTLKDVLEQLGVDSIEKADAATLTEIYSSTPDADKAKLVDALKDGLRDLPTNELKIAMQTNHDTFETVKAIEAMTGIAVNSNVSAEASELLEGDIIVTGAALNADNGVSEVSINISKETNIDLGAGYKKAIPLGITLEGVSSAASGMQIPVTITMPIPLGVDMSKLVILHMNPDGTVNERLGVNNGYSYDYENRTITFTVTHFSTFVFAEEADAETGDNEGGTDDGNTGDGNNNNTGNTGDNNNNTGNNGNNGNNNNSNTGNSNNNTGNNNNSNTGNSNNSNNNTGNNNSSNSNTGSNNITVNGTVANAAPANAVSPKTDDAGMWIPCVLFACAIAGIGFMVRRKRA